MLEYLGLALISIGIVAAVGFIGSAFQRKPLSQEELEALGLTENIYVPEERRK